MKQTEGTITPTTKEPANIARHMAVVYVQLFFRTTDVTLVTVFLLNILNVASIFQLQVPYAVATLAVWPITPLIALVSHKIAKYFIILTSGATAHALQE